MWVEILIDKFFSHRPTERLLDQWRLLGLDVAAGTVAGGLERLEPLFQPLYDALLARNAESAFAQADETRWMVFIELEGKTGYRWWLWVFLGEDTVVFRLDPSRSHDVPEGHFPAGCPRGADGRPLLGLQGHGPGEAGQRGAGLLLGTRPAGFRHSRQRLAGAQRVGLGLAPANSRSVSLPSSTSNLQGWHRGVHCRRHWVATNRGGHADARPMRSWPTRNCRLPAARCW